jgi:hypothetical protein
MRFALIATATAAAVALPFAPAATAPQMSGEEFLTAVRCTAYQDLDRSDAELAEAKYQLNTEARLQPAEMAAEAQAAVTDIARKAVNIQTAADAVMISQERAAACSGVQLATGADSPSVI